MARRANAKKGLRIPDLTGVEGRTLVAEGEYLAKVVEVTEEEGSAAPYLKWKLQVEGGTVYNNTSMATNSLWNLRSWLDALGADIPDGSEDIDPSTYEDMTLMVRVEHEVYEGKPKPHVIDFWPVEKKELKKATASAKAPAKEEPQKEEEESDSNARRRARRADRKTKDGGKKAAPKIEQDELADFDESELLDFAEEHKLDVDLDDLPTLRKKRAALIDAGIEAGVIAE